MERQYSYQAFRRAKGIRSKYFRSRQELIDFYAQRGESVARVWSKAAHGYLGKGDTIDAIHREIELTREIFRLTEQLHKKRD